MSNQGAGSTSSSTTTSSSSHATFAVKYCQIFQYVFLHNHCSELFDEPYSPNLLNAHNFANLCLWIQLA